MTDTQRAVLAALGDGPVTGPDLAADLDISRAAVWKHVEALRAAGVEVESGPEGYSIGTIHGYSGPAIEACLEAPFSIEYHDAIDSTNERARILAGDGATDVAIVADRQTGGRGRLDREWSSPPGGIWMSLLVRPRIPPGRVPLLTLAAAVSVTEASREIGVEAQIKWPNDVVVPAANERGYLKLAGILTAMEGETDRVEWVVVGMGVNANVDDEELPPGATSLRALGDDVDRRAFVQTVLEDLERWRADLESVVGRWRELALTLGQRVQIDRADGAVVGEAVDVTATGGLVVETENGRVTVQAGDCEHLRPA